MSTISDKIELVNSIVKDFADYLYSNKCANIDKVAQFTMAILCSAKEACHTLPHFKEELSYYNITSDSADSVIKEIRDICGDAPQEILSSCADTLILDFYANKSWGKVIQPNEVSRLVLSLLKNYGCETIYNPFAGFASYAMGDDFIKCYIGQERDNTVYNLAKILMQIKGNSGCHFENTDPVVDWHECGADCIVSTPPFGLRIQGEKGEYNGYTYDEFVVSKFLSSKVSLGFFIMPRGFCFRNNGYAFSLKKDIIEKNYLEMAINLPSGIFPNTGVATTLIALNKGRKKDASTLLINAENMYTLKSRSEKILDVDTVLNAIYSHDSENSFQVSKHEMFENDCSFDVNAYTSLDLVALEGQKVLSLSEILILDKGEKFNFDGKLVSNVLESTNFVDNIAYLDIVKNEVFVDQPKYRFSGPHIAFNMQGKVYLHKDDGSFYIGSALKNFVFKIKEDVIDGEYLAYVLLSSNILQKYISWASSNIHRFLKNRIVIYSDIKKQRQIVSNIKHKYFESERERLGIREVGSDLTHMLRMPKSKIGNKIEFLLESPTLSEKDRLHVKAIEDNFNYMLRVINTVGADFSTMDIKFHEFPLAEFLRDYSSSLNNMEFSNIYSILTDIDISEEITISGNEDLIRVLLDTAFLNVYKHAFIDKGSDDNKVLLGCHIVEFEEKPYACIRIANNGKHLDISIEDYVAKGAVAGETGNTGKGGYHIYTIAKKHGGFIYLTSSLEWPFILEVLLPVDNIDNSNFEVYESKCV